MSLQRSSKLILSSLVVVAITLLATFLARHHAQKMKEPEFRLAIVGFFDVEASILAEAAQELGMTVDVYARRDFLTEPNKRRAVNSAVKPSGNFFSFSKTTDQNSSKKTNYPHYHAAIMRCMGLRVDDISDASRAQFEACDVLIPFPGTGDFFTLYGRNVGGVDGQRTQKYLQTITPHNAKAFLTLLLRETNPSSPLAERFANAEVPDVEELPESGFVYAGHDVSPDYESWLKRSDVPQLDHDAPVVAIVGSFVNPYKSGDAAALVAIVEAFASRGIRAVPIYGVKRNPELLENLRPDLVVVCPLGKLLPENDAVELFQRLDVPVLAAINLSAPESAWRSEPVGMTTTYQNLAIALPELEGVVAPIAVASLETNDEGFEYRTPLKERIERLVQRASNWLKLRKLSNAEKRIAIFYRRSPGAAAIVAQSLDPVPSLYNVLCDLRDAGYDLGDDFPDEYDVFAQQLDLRGRTIGQWAPGAFRKFLNDAEPERVPTKQYLEWSERLLSEKLRRETLDVWGPAPGLAFAGQDQDGNSFVAVSRLQFGNVVLMPEPTTSIIADDGKADDFSSVHGTNKAPPHFYQAAYLWAREAFKADVVFHFGTHGALEFTRGKSALLTENDWPDALAGDIPCVYLYSVNNVGEALLAKRRINATIVSHTTPPFQEAELNPTATPLLAALDALDAAQDHDVREELDQEIERLAKEAGLTLFYESYLPQEFHCDDEDSDAAHEHDQACLRAEFYREQLARLSETAVADGLHVVGRPWTEERLQATADAIGSENALANLRASTNGLELQRLRDALDGRFIPPSTGGDPLVNPDSIPTGRNIAGTNIEQTPDPAVFKLAQRLVDELVENYRHENGSYPRRVAITLWGGEYIRTRGLGVAQALTLLGVRPIFDKRGHIQDLELIPDEELRRPRIDLLIQTSGQFRDAAPSRIELLDRAVRIVANADDGEFPNYVKANAAATAQKLVAKGYLPEEASELSTARIFGATNALSYGTGIRATVERSDQWETRAEIAQQYLLNMGGIYRNGRVWGTPIEGLLEANVEGTDVVMQTRSSNLWGPVKLDHLYEFGTLAAVVREKTGKDPTFLLADARRPSKVRNQNLAEAMRDELQTTFWNKRWLENLTRERGGAAGAALAKGAQNLFGWSAVGAEGLVDDATWRRTVDVIVNDSLEIGVDEYLEETNPAALAETAAIALDAARKNYWNPSDAERRNLAEKIAEILQKHGATCSYNICANQKLQEFIIDALDERKAEQLRHDLDDATKLPEENADVAGITMVETSSTNLESDASKPAEDTQNDIAVVTERRDAQTLALCAALLLVLAGFFAQRYVDRKR